MMSQPDAGHEQGEHDGRTDDPQRINLYVPVVEGPPDKHALYRNDQPGDRHEPPHT